MYKVAPSHCGYPTPDSSSPAKKQESRKFILCRYLFLLKVTRKEKPARILSLPACLPAPTLESQNEEIMKQNEILGIFLSWYTSSTSKFFFFCILHCPWCWSSKTCLCHLLIFLQTYHPQMWGIFQHHFRNQVTCNRPCLKLACLLANVTAQLPVIIFRPPILWQPFLYLLNCSSCNLGPTRLYACCCQHPQKNCNTNGKTLISQILLQTKHSLSKFEWWLVQWGLFFFTWPRACIMVAPSCVLWITPCHNAPFISLQSRIRHLQRHFAYKLFPAFLKKIHDSRRLFRCCEGGENCHAIADSKPPEVHPGRAHIPNEVTTLDWHEIKNPIGNWIWNDIEFVYSSVRILFCLITVNVIELGVV